MEVELSTFINLYAFTTGRRLFALGQMQKVAREGAFTRLAKHCDAAVVHDRDTQRLETRWIAVSRRPRRHSAVPAVDGRVDRTLTAIRDTARAQTAGLEDDEPEIAKKVEAFLVEIFPAGPQAVTNLPYIEELAAVDEIVAKMKGPLSPLVEELGLSRLHTRLTKLAREYRKALEAPSPEALAFGDLRAARAKGQENLLIAVAMVLGQHCTSTPEDREARARYLAPVFAQNAAIAEYLRARKPIEDIDPATGEVAPAAPAAPVPTSPSDASPGMPNGAPAADG